MAQLRPFDGLPLPYGGGADEDAYSHILKFDDFIEIHALDDANSRAKFKYSLKGDARSWVEGKVYADYDALKAAFLQQFSGFKAKGSDGFFELTYKMGEPVEAHLQKLRRMAESLNYGDVVLMDRFKRSLPEKVRVQLATMDGTLDEVATAAQEIVNVLTTASPVVTKEVHFAAQQGEDLHTKLDTLVDKVSKMSVRPRSRSRSRSTSRGRGHSPGYKGKYRQRSGSRGSSDRGRKRTQNQKKGRCHFCDRKGHYVIECRALQEYKRENGGKHFH